MPAPTGPTASVNSDGTATAPADAPQAVKDVIAAGNAITNMPYLYGGGHGSFEASGYDCSGSVSYALHGGGLLSTPLDSTGFMTWGESGPGQWITVYSNPGHAYMVVAGIRFDTSGAPPRWQAVDARHGRLRRHAPARVLGSSSGPEAHVLAGVADAGLERQADALGHLGVRSSLERSRWRRFSRWASSWTAASSAGSAPKKSRSRPASRIS